MNSRRLPVLLILFAMAVVVEVAIYTVGTAQTAGELPRSPTLQVTHEVKGKDLYLKMTVTGFSFSLENMGKGNKQGEGHAHLYIDGKKVAKMFEPQFVYRNLSSGQHQIVVELAHNNHESYGVTQSFVVEVN